MLRALLPAALALFATVALASEPPRLSLEADFDRDDIVIVTGDGTRHRFDVYVAATGRQRQHGLMFVEALPESSGMLFFFDRPQRVAMWMKNTLIPLDMLFVRRDGTIANLAANTKPESHSTHASAGAVIAVVELNGGTAARLGILPGDRVVHRYFND